MNSNQNKQSESQKSKDIALHYMQTLVDVARESFLLLDADLRVISANEVFYQSFQVTREQTEQKYLYELGNGQWNIPELKSLLENLLPDKKVVKNYEVTHGFENIGVKTMLLNARQIDAVQLIILAIEDISQKKSLENKLSEYAKGLETLVDQRTAELTKKIKELNTLNKSMVGREVKMVELKKEIEDLKRTHKNGNGNHNNGHKK